MINLKITKEIFTQKDLDNFLKMNDESLKKEYLEILNKVTEIHNFLMVDNYKSACVHLGILIETLAQKIR